MMKKLHFISIGGSAMHNLAIALLETGISVTGSDDEIVEPSRSRLALAGLLPVALGWYPDKVTANLDAVVVGMHARADNPEMLRARELGVRLFSYPEFIFEHSKNKLRVVVGGSHGKTSTTAAILHVLNHSGRKFDFLIGASVAGLDQSVRLSEDAPIMVIEGDEYLSSPADLRPKFHLYRAHVSVLTGISWDHINVFPTKEIYNEQFEIFLKTMEPGGTVFYHEEPVLNKLVEKADWLVRVPYGMPPHKIVDGTTYLSLGDSAGVPLSIFGEHNLLNLYAAYLVARHLGISAVEFAGAISSFTGAARRLEKIAQRTGLTVFWDFAHSPSKLKATTSSVRKQYPDKYLIACIELHTFSSLDADFLNEYANSLDDASTCIVFYDRATSQHKALRPIEDTYIRQAFKRPDLIIIHERIDLEQKINAMNLTDSVLLLMSSGNFGGMNVKEFAKSLV